MQVLFVKVCPRNIEATVFAILLGSNNFASTILSPLFGSYLNDNYIHVTNDSLKLPGGEKGILDQTIISLILTSIGTIFVFLIPTNE
jgi:hypothetical protein